MKSLISLVLFFILNLCIVPLAESSEFSHENCPATVCDEDGSCTAVEQCFWVDASAPHCSVQVNSSHLSCNDIQSRAQLTGVNQCQSLGEGSIGSPWCSIEQAAKNATAGSLVLIAPGRYLTPGGTHGLSNFSTQGTKEKPIVFRNYEFNVNAPSIPVNKVDITPYTEISGWSPVSEGDDYLICHHQGIVNDNTTFNGIVSNIKTLDSNKPLLKLFNEGCGSIDVNSGKGALENITSLESFKQSEEGFYTQIWKSGTYVGSSTCPVINSGNGGEVLLRVAKSESVKTCADISMNVTGVGHTIHLQSVGNVCGDLEESLVKKGINLTNLNFDDNEADHIRFEGLNINAASYGVTIETDHIALSYSRIEGSYKDAIKAIGPEPWDHRKPNQCKRMESPAIANQPSNELNDMINYCMGNNTPLSIGDLIEPPSCDGDTLDVAALNPAYFYWQGEESDIRAHMLTAQNATTDEYCVGAECILEPKESIKKYCQEVVPTYSLASSTGSTPSIPDQCTDFYYFNAEHTKVLNNEITYFGEDAIDITGGDNWLVRGNTIHDSVITHGSGQLPSGVLTKNVSHNNTIEENLFFNINHSITGILSLGGTPSKEDGAANIIARNNVILSSSAEKIVNINGCKNCVVANNLFLDVTLGEENSRGKGFIHFGGHRKSCFNSAGTKVACSGAKRSAIYEGESNSVVNNIMDSVKWRDRDSFRLMSFGGHTQSNQTDYLYFGDQLLCMKGNHVNGGEGIIAVTTHVKKSDVAELACDLASSSTKVPLQFTNERLQYCISEKNSSMKESTSESLISCLSDTSGTAPSEPITLSAQSIFSQVGITSSFDLVTQVGLCSNSENSCTTDNQCGTATCNIDASYLNKCTLGPNNTTSPASASCTMNPAITVSPTQRSTTNAYPEFAWEASDTDIQYRFLLYRFHPDGGVNNKAWSELLENKIIAKTDCVTEGEKTCKHRAPNLLNDDVYTWKLRRHNSYGWASWSGTNVIYVKEPDRIGHTSQLATGVIFPAAGDTVTNQPVLAWQHDPYAQEYSILLYRYENGYSLLVNLKLTEQQLSCSYNMGCNISVADLLTLMGSSNTSLTPGTYTWKTKKWTNGQASSWNITSSPFYVN